MGAGKKGALATQLVNKEENDSIDELDSQTGQRSSNSGIAAKAEAVRSQRGVKSSQRADGHSHDSKDHGGHGGHGHDSKDGSARFEGDEKLEEIHDGSAELNKGASGIQVVKLQQALVDLGYMPSESSIEGVDGDFGKRTKAALLRFQHDAGITETGKFDKATIDALHAKFDTRQPYIDEAGYDPANPKTRTLNAEEKKAVNEALVPTRGKSGPSTFTETIKGETYGDRMATYLGKLIPSFVKELHTDKEPLRKDPAKNFHDWSVLEGTAKASKDATDAVYGDYPEGAEITHASGTFIDQWEDEEARNSGLSPAEKQEKAAGKVHYFIAANCTHISKMHGAVPTDGLEAAILAPIVNSFVDTDAKVEEVLKTETGWEGAQLDGQVYLQRYKQSDDTKNRKQLWEIFHTCIHEYIHALAHEDFKNHAGAFDAAGDSIRYNSLTEGFCDFFTENVRATITVSDTLRRDVEGPYYDSTVAAPAVSPGTYPSKAQAEQVVSIVGINNAEAGYFLGEVDKIGG